VFNKGLAPFYLISFPFVLIVALELCFVLYHLRLKGSILDKQCQVSTVFRFGQFDNDLHLLLLVAIYVLYGLLAQQSTIMLA
jgi:hypothetical protein